MMSDFKMYLFKFEPNNYGALWIFASDTYKAALYKLKTYIKKQHDEGKDVCNDWEKWKDAEVGKYPDEYTLERFDINAVIEEEHC